MSGMSGLSGLSGSKYYRPYIPYGSDSDSQCSLTSDSDSDLSSASYGDGDGDGDGSADGPNFRRFATDLQLVATGGPPLLNISTQLYYHQRTNRPNALYSDYSKAFDPIKAAPRDSNTYESFANPCILPTPTPPVVQPTFNPPLLGANTPPPLTTEKVANIVLLNSRDRDRTVYPQPTFVRLHLPREYTNVVNFQIMQISLLTSFYYFRPDKFNLDITIYEQNRTTTDTNGITLPLKITNTIRQGSYNITSLLAEITKWLNNVPIFVDFIKGFADFQSAFQSTGDFGVNFNEPGDYYYDNLQNDFVSNPTKDFIVTRYWKNRYGNQTSYTLDELRVAYYYPVLKELLLDHLSVSQPNLAAGLGIDSSILTTGQVQDRVIYTFQGIDDPVILAVINANQPVLDKYRLDHTFRYYLVNKYTLAVEGQGQNVIVTSSNLNTSLINLLNTKNTQFFNEQFNINNITSNTFTSLQTSNNQILAVIQDMNIYQQEQFANYFGIPFNDYTPSYYSHLNWTILTKNGIGAVGVPKNYNDPLYNPINSKQYSQNIIAPLSKEPPHFFPNMVNLSNTIDTFKILGEYNYPYSITKCNVNLNSNIINHSTNRIQPGLKDNSVNALIHISSSRYTVFEFASPVRQTLQIETLPRPKQYRIPLYNSLNFNSTIQKFFDVSYSFVDSPYFAMAPYKYKMDNMPYSNIIDIHGWGVSNATPSDSTTWSWGLSYASSISSISQNLLSINTYKKSLFYTLTCPDYANYLPTSTFRYQLNIDSLSYDLDGNLAPPRQAVRVFFYKDRGGFMADVSGNRQEYPYNAIASTIITREMCNVDIPLTVYPKQQIFVTMRPDEASFGSVNIKLVPYFSTGYTIETLDTSLDSINPFIDSPYDPKTLSNYNYAKVYDSNFLSLPILSTLWPPDPNIDSSQSIVFASNIPIGYDVSSISNDYTDYMPFIVGKSTNFTPYKINVGIDPISEYQFEYKSSYDPASQSYFYSGSSNNILFARLLDVYPVGPVPHRQEKIVHYYSLNYIISGWDVDHYSPYIASNTVQLPYSQYSTDTIPIRGYDYVSPIATQDSNEYLSLGTGPCGFSFTPGEGIWDIDKIVLRSAFTDSNNDPNRAIRYLGVYNMQDILDVQTPTVNLRSSICILSTSAVVTYNPKDPTTLLSGFDLTGGTYYEFKKTSIPVSNPNSTIVGYSESQGTITNDANNLYSIIAFDGNEKVAVIRAMSGSLVPFPYYNTATVSTTYTDGTKPPQSFFYDLVVPSGSSQSNFPIPGPTFSDFGPPAGYDGTQSFYALSQPIGTSVVHYVNAKPFIIDVSGIYAYDLPFSANALIGNVANYIMTQNTNYQIWAYKQDLRTVSLSWNLTGDVIFPPDEQTSIIGVAGNSTDYVFLGAKPYTETSFVVRLKKFNPATGLLYEFYPLSTLVISTDFQLNSFTYTDTDGFIISAKTSSNPVLYRCVDRLNLQIYPFTADPTANIYHSQDSSSDTFYWLRQDANYNASTFYHVENGTGFPGTPWTIQAQSVSTLPKTFRTMAVSLFRGEVYDTSIDNILFTSAEDEFNANFFSVYQFNSNTGQAVVLKSIVQFSNSNTGIPIPVKYVQPGFNSSKWFMTNEYPYLWANRNNTIDRVSRVESAWQIFYPWQKIVLKKIANNINPIVDLTGIQYPEYPHTQMFYYSNLTKMTTDIGTRWGCEQSTNFVVAETEFAGFYFNSYIFTCPLRASANSNDKQYIAIRNYSPNEESGVMVRFVLGNKYTFGYTTLQNIGDEAALYKSGVSNQLFNTNYGIVLSNFDNQFQIQKYWGSNLVPGFPGSNLGFSTFTEFSLKYSDLYQQYNTNAAKITKITSNVRNNINNYILTSLKFILPPSALTRQQYTDPLQYSILWNSPLQPAYQKLTENWGLGYNLGFSKQDTPFGTVQRAESFYKIIDDYIYLRISPEYNMNKLDFGGTENLALSREATGQTKSYYGKLLLNNFNSFSQTLVQNPVSFSPPIGRLEHVSFQWLNLDGSQVNNTNCEWNISVSVTEQLMKTPAPITSGA